MLPVLSTRQEKYPPPHPPSHIFPFHKNFAYFCFFVFHVSSLFRVCRKMRSLLRGPCEPAPRLTSRLLKESTRPFQQPVCIWQEASDWKFGTARGHATLRRFLPHALSGGLVHLRHFGLFANGNRRVLPAAAPCSERRSLPGLRRGHGNCSSSAPARCASWSSSPVPSSISGFQSRQTHNRGPMQIPPDTPAWISLFLTPRVQPPASAIPGLQRHLHLCWAIQSGAR